MAALQPDGSGGSLLLLGIGAALDITNVAPGLLRSSAFQIAA